MPRSGRRRQRVAFIPSVSGGLGHVTRTAKLARELGRADPSLALCFVLPEARLRRINIEAVAGLGYPVRLLPEPIRHDRDAVVKKILGDIDVVIEDTERRLIAYRRILPRIRAWISVPMLPLWDELFLDWTLLEHADHILYTYPIEMPVPDELELFREKLTVTGPFAGSDEFPSRTVARRRLRLRRRDHLITYAPRGLPFGREFGLRVINAVVGAFIRIRRQHPDVKLVLTGVADVRAIQPSRLPPLTTIDGLEVKAMLPRRQLVTVLAASDVAIVEGTSGLFDAAALETPVIMVPGPIYETTLEGEWVARRDAGLVIGPEELNRRVMYRSMMAVLCDRDSAVQRADRLHAIVGQGGEQSAVATILRVIDGLDR
jgi:hypothetical protein